MKDPGTYQGLNKWQHKDFFVVEFKNREWSRSLNIQGLGEQLHHQLTTAEIREANWAALREHTEKAGLM